MDQLQDLGIPVSRGNAFCVQGESELGSGSDIDSLFQRRLYLTQRIRELRLRIVPQLGGEQLGHCLVDPWLLATVVVEYHASQLEGRQFQDPPALGPTFRIAARLALTREKPAPESYQLAKEIIRLSLENEAILQRVISSIKSLAPNLNSLVGPETAAALLCEAGGVKAMAAVAAGNVQVMGGRGGIGIVGERQNQAKNGGLFARHESVRNCPPEHRMKMIRMLATNAAKMARLDSQQADPTGYTGVVALRSLQERFRRTQENQTPKSKALPPIEDRPRRKRGGRRLRRDRERTEQTQLRKARNRLPMGVVGEQQVGQLGAAVGLGMLSKKIRKQAKREQRGLQSRRLGEQARRGLISQVECTGAKEIKLLNPGAREGGQSVYFAK